MLTKETIQSFCEGEKVNIIMESIFGSHEEKGTVYHVEENKITIKKFRSKTKGWVFNTGDNVIINKQEKTKNPTQKKMNMIALLEAENLLHHIVKHKESFSRMTFDHYEKVENGFKIYNVNNSGSNYKVFFDGFKSYRNGEYVPTEYTYKIFKDGWEVDNYGKVANNLRWIGTALVAEAKEKDLLGIFATK